MPHREFFMVYVEFSFSFDPYMTTYMTYIYGPNVNLRNVNVM